MTVVQESIGVRVGRVIVAILLVADLGSDGLILLNQHFAHVRRNATTLQSATDQQGIADRQNQIINLLHDLVNRRTADRYTGHDADVDWAARRQADILLPARRPSATQP